MARSKVEKRSFWLHSPGDLAFLRQLLHDAVDFGNARLLLALDPDAGLCFGGKMSFHVGLYLTETLHTLICLSAGSGEGVLEKIVNRGQQLGGL